MYRALMLAAWIGAPLFCGSIEGTVTNAMTGEPVKGVEVRFLDRHSVVSQTATDGAGTYRLTNLQDGGYSGQFSKDGFQDGSAPPLQVAGQLATRADQKLIPLGGLRGRVIDEEGKPAAKVRVEIEARDGETATDENGEFVFKELRAGAYTVVAKPEPATRVEQGVKLGSVPVYFPSATQKADAVPVKVALGAEVSGITIRLRSVPVHRVAGIVLDETGKPVTGATVRLLGRAGHAAEMLLSGAPLFGHDASATIAAGREAEVATVESRADGTFEFAAVEPGDWRLSAMTASDDEHALAGIEPAAVSEKDVNDIRIRVVAPFAVSVTMDRGDGRPEDSGENGAGRVWLSPLEAQPRLNLDPQKNIGRIEGIFPGRYRVLARGWDDASYVGSIESGGRDVLNGVVEFGAGGADPLQVRVRHDVGSVQGSVENGAGSSVLLVRRENGDVLHYRVERCGEEGAFRFTNVTPGDYYAVALEREPRPAGSPAELIETAASLGTAVRVEPSSSATVNLRLQRWPD